MMSGKIFVGTTIYLFLKQIIKNLWCQNDTRKIMVGKMKDDTNRITIVQFFWLKWIMWAFITEYSESCKQATELIKALFLKRYMVNSETDAL